MWKCVFFIVIKTLGGSYQSLNEGGKELHTQRPLWQKGESSWLISLSFVW